MTLLTQNIQEGISRERKGQAIQVFESGSREDTDWLYVKQKGPKTGARFQSYCLHKTSHVYIIGRKHLVQCEDLLTVNINNGDLYKLHSVPLKHIHTQLQFNLSYFFQLVKWTGKEQRQRKRWDWLVQVWAGCQNRSGDGERESIQLYAMKEALQTCPECLWDQMLCTPIYFLKLTARCYTSYVP